MRLGAILVSMVSVAIVLVGVLLFSGIQERQRQRLGPGPVPLDVAGEWTHICLSSGHQYPDHALRRLGGTECWGELGVPDGRIHLSFLRPDGSCERRFAEGHFFVPHASETRCLTRREVIGMALVDRDGIYSIERMQPGGN